MGYLLTVRRLGAQRQGGVCGGAVVATFLIETEGEGMLQQQLPFWMLMHFFLHSCNTACSDPHKHPFLFTLTRIKLIKVFFRLSIFLMIGPQMFQFSYFNSVYAVSIANLRYLLTFVDKFGF